MPAYKTYKNDAEKLLSYRHRIKQGENANQRWHGKGHNRWRKYDTEFEPIDFPPEWAEIEAMHRVNVPLGTGTIDALLASLIAVEIEPHVINLAHGTRDKAEIANHAIKEVARAQRLSTKFKDALKDAEIVGIGYIKVGYDFEEETKRRPPNEEEIAARIDEVYTAAEENPDQEIPDWLGVLELASQGEVEETLTLRDRIIYEYVPWEKLIVDPTARRDEDVRWVCRVHEMPLYEVQQSPGFREYASLHRHVKALDDLKPDARISKELRVEGETDNPEDDRVTVYEFYDLESGTVCYFPKEGEFVLDERVNPFAQRADYEDRNPFVAIRIRSGRTYRGISDFELIEPLLDELNIYRSKLATYIERFGPKYVGPARAIPEGSAADEAIKSTEIGRYVGLEDQQYDAKSIGTLDMPQLAAEFFQMQDRIVHDIEEITGASEVLRGVYPEREVTATTTAQTVSASSARQSEKRLNEEEPLVAIFERTLILIQKTYNADRVSRLVGREVGDEVWEWSGEDIAMETALEVALTPRVVKTQEWKEERALKLANYVAPFMESGHVDVPNLLRLTLRDMGYTEEEISDTIKTDEEKQNEEEQARQVETQQTADLAVAGEGVNPADVEAEELPPELAAAAEMQGESGGPLDFLAGP